MYKIGICDDDTIILMQLKDFLERLSFDSGAKFSIESFSCAQDLLEFVKEDKNHFDLLILDIIMDKKSGLKAASEIRETDEDTAIIFLTSSPDFVYKGYDVQAIGYVLKPIDEVKLGKIIINDWSRRNRRDYLTIRANGTQKRIPASKIIYLESSGKKATVYTEGEKIETYAKLSDLLGELPGDSFFSCHKSYVINLSQVAEISAAFFKTRQGINVPISRSRARETKKAFLKFIKS